MIYNEILLSGEVNNIIINNRYITLGLTCKKYSPNENSNIVYGKSNLKSGFNLTPIFILLAMLVVAFEWILYKKGN